MTDKLLLLVVALVLLGFAIVRYAGDTATGDDSPPSDDPDPDTADTHPAPANDWQSAPADGGQPDDSPDSTDADPTGDPKDADPTSRPPPDADLDERLNRAKADQRWSDAIEICDELTATADDPDSTAEYAYTAAIIARDKLDNPRQAVSWFDATLDADPMKLRAFEAIDRILTDLEDWKELERAYRRQLQRIVQQVDRPADDLKTRLWKNLGRIYADRLDHPESARQALQTADAISDDPEIDEMLEELED